MNQLNVPVEFYSSKNIVLKSTLWKCYNQFMKKTVNCVKNCLNDYNSICLFFGGKREQTLLFLVFKANAQMHSGFCVWVRARLNNVCEVNRRRAEGKKLQSVCCGRDRNGCFWINVGFFFRTKRDKRRPGVRLNL